MRAQRRLPHAFHGFRIFGIGNVVREAPVGVKAAASRRVRPQGRKHAVRVKAAHAVARVYDDLHARKRVVVIRALHAFFDKILQMRAVYGQIVKFFGFDLCRRRTQFHRLGGREDLCELCARNAARARKEFEAVAVPRVVACGDLHRAVTVFGLRRHEHGGRGAQPAVQDMHALRGKFRDHRTADALGGHARIVPDRDF